MLPVSMALKCSTCMKRILSHAAQLKCIKCNDYFHILCLPNVCKNDYNHIDKSTWYCPECINGVFPFNHISDEFEFIEELSQFKINTPRLSISDLNRLVFNPLEIIDDEKNSCLFDSDPDLQYFNQLSNNALNCDYFFEDNFNKRCQALKVDDDNFSICHLNTRSIPKNFDNLRDYLSNLSINFSIIAISETWLNSDTCNLYDLPGYNSVHNVRNSKRGGGVSIFARNNLSFSIRKDLEQSNTYIECIFIETKDKVIGVVYRPPNTDISVFNQHIESILEVIKRERKHCYIGGDYNINLLNTDTHEPSANFIDTMFSHGFFPLINKPTRVSKNTATIIDNIFYNRIDSRKAFNGLLLTDISDHYPVFHIDLNVNRNNQEHFFVSRSFSGNNIKTFNDLNENSNWDEVLFCNDPQTAYNMFHNIIMKNYTIAFPLRKQKCGYKNKLPWLTSALRTSIKTKNKLYMYYIKHPTDENEMLYRGYKSKLLTLLKRTERDYFNGLLSSSQTNMRKKWSILKEIINKKVSSCYPTHFNINGTMVSDKHIIANAFNNYFNNVGKNLAEKIPVVSESPSSYITNNVTETIFIEPVSSLEIANIIKQLKDSSAGWDDLSPKIVKQATHSILSPLTHVLNLSLANGVFPQELKITKLIPLFKANDNMIFSNYRPIALLSVFSKTN